MREDSKLNPARGTTRNYRFSTRSSPKSQHVDTARPASLYEPSPIQDRIRQWQAQGAANALAPDAVSVRSIPISECPSTASRPKSEHGDEFKIRVGGRKKQKAEDDQEKDRSRSAPRRRIISDSHWKTKKEVKDGKDSKPTVTPKPDSRRYDPSYTSNQERNRDKRRSKTQHESPAADLEPSRLSQYDDGIRVKALPDDIAPPAYDLESGADEDLARQFTTESMVSGEFGRHSQLPIRPDENTPSNRQPSRYAELLGSGGDATQSVDVAKTRRGGLLGKTRDIFMKSENVPAVSNRIPSIEAWLDEQPDPFVDEGNLEDLPPAEMPQPLKKRTHRRRTSRTKSIVAGPNQIWNSVSPQAESGPPETPRRLGSTEPPNSADNSTPKPRTPVKNDLDESDGSPSNLRRRGARVRRQRDSAKEHPVADGVFPDPTKTPVEILAADDQTAKATSPPHRPCPPTGTHRLSTIASMETFRETNIEPSPQAMAPQDVTDLKRKLTTHDDLMSVLSLPRGSRNRRSTRRARSARTKESSASAQEILASLAADEQKYGRELRTLVDGVIPVLLQFVLSKTDSTAATGLFTSSSTGQDGMSVTKPIIDMGIALERLKSLHNRIPLDNVDRLLIWAQTSEKAYRDYLQAWRLGFQDVVVNLAPIENSPSSNQGMARDKAGDLVDTEGKKVDVAYLLKRPLVRVKTLSKNFSLIQDQCGLSSAAEMADIYAELTVLAKRRNQEEQSRLEDESATNVDPTRSRDIRSMAPTTQVDVNKTRRVKARDFFNLTIYHSSGQRLDCGVELVFRDNARGDAIGGDVLVCEVDDTGKWLLFVPIELNCISARRGEDGFDLVIMVRGRAGLGKEWHELLALKTDDKEAVTEWMNMLGSNPLPPRLNRTPDFVQPPAPLAISAAEEPLPSKPEVNSQPLNKIVDQKHLDVPIGEPSVLGALTESSRRSEATIPLVHRPSPGLSLGGGLAPKHVPQYQVPTTVTRKPVQSVVSSDRSTISDHSNRYTPTILTSSSSNTESTRLGQASQQRKHPEFLDAAQQPLVPKPGRDSGSHSQSINNHCSPEPGKTKDASHQWQNPLVEHKPHRQSPGDPIPPSQKPQALPRDGNNAVPSSSLASASPPKRPVYHRAVSSTPSRELPTVNKVRNQQVQPSPPTSHPPQRSPETQRSEIEADRGQDRSRRGHQIPSRTQIFTEDVPAPPAHVSRQDRPSIPSSATLASPPATPPHRSGVLQPISNNKPGPVLKPTPSPSDKTLKRRTSSPLKHEYAPSTSSDSSSDYDSDSESGSSSDTSEDVVSEHGDVPTPLVAVAVGDRRSSKPSVRPSMPSSSMRSTGTRTLAPSDSASQGPYRKVPSSTTIPAHKKSRTIALICSWSDRGMWEQIYPDECSIVISSGLIEAFEMSAAHSNPQVQLGARSPDSESRASSLSSQPLVAFELTPIVPLRRGTALDISIRSPPTANSKIRTTNNVMFRSRNPEECEALYGMINWARCNNPTYIQLQNARPRRQPTVTFNVGQAQNSRAKSSSWFSFGSQKDSSYRASSAPTPASIDMSVESTGTMASAFSALRRFGVSNAFNLNRSSVLRKNGSSATGDSLYSSTSGTRTGSGSSTPAPSQMGFVPGKDGPNVPSTSAAAAEGGGMINNMKIRLYMRKGQGWENLGSARLTVLPPPGVASGKTTPNTQSLAPGVSPPGTPLRLHSPSNLAPIGQPGQPRGPRLSSSNHTPHRVHGNGREKRILVTRNKNHDAVLLDSVLGESCFERVMQTGIAVKVWNEDEMIAQTGGVTLGKERVYMMQFPGTREAGWVFGLCGTYRYGVGATE